MASRAARQTERTSRPEANGQARARPAKTLPERLAEFYKVSLAVLAQATGLPEVKLALPDSELDTAERAKVEQVQELLLSLSRVMNQDYIGTWLTKPNDACKGKTPLQLMQRGEYDRLAEMIYRLHAGEPF